MKSNCIGGGWRTTTLLLWTSPNRLMKDRACRLYQAHKASLEIQDATAWMKARPRASSSGRISRTCSLFAELVRLRNLQIGPICIWNWNLDIKRNCSWLWPCSHTHVFAMCLDYYPSFECCVSNVACWDRGQPTRYDQWKTSRMLFDIKCIILRPVSGYLVR